MDNENLIPDFEPEAEELLIKRVKQHKIIGCIIAACLVVLGILILVMPADAWFAINYGVAVGIILMGIFELIVFFRTAGAYRNEGALASGILLVVMGLVIFALSAGDPSNQATLLAIFAAVLGFFALYRGIMQFFSFSRFKKLDEKDTGWLMLSGILNVIIGVLMVFLPFAGLLAVGVVLGLYLVVGGVALMAEAVSGKAARRK